MTIEDRELTTKLLLKLRDNEYAEFLTASRLLLAERVVSAEWLATKQNLDSIDKIITRYFTNSV